MMLSMVGWKGFACLGACWSTHSSTDRLAVCRSKALGVLGTARVSKWPVVE